MPMSFAGRVAIVFGRDDIGISIGHGHAVQFVGLSAPQPDPLVPFEHLGRIRSELRMQFHTRESLRRVILMLTQLEAEYVEPASTKEPK